MDFDFGTIVFFAAFLWFLLSEIRPKKKPGQRDGGRASRRTTPVRTSTPAERLGSGGHRRPTFDTQAEAARLEKILYGLDYEPTPVVISLETEPARAARSRVTYDDAAEEAERQRVETARARDRELTDADHAAFDARVREGGPRGRAARRVTRQRRMAPPGPGSASLRDAVVWREILGKPVSLRDL